MAMLFLVSCAGSVDVNTTDFEELVTIYNDAASKFKNAKMVLMLLIVTMLNEKFNMLRIAIASRRLRLC